MVDQVSVGNTTGQPNDYTVSTDDAGASGQVQRVKLTYSADGSATHITADADGLLVNLGANNDVTIAGSVTVADGGGSISIDDNGATISIDDGAGSLTVDNGTLAVVGGGTEATALRVTIANDSTGVLSVDDNGATISIDDGGGTITIDGSVSITGTVDTELPTAAVISAENTAAPTAPSVYAFPTVFDGTNWDRAPGNSADGQLVNLGTNNDVTVTGSVSVTGSVDTELPAAAALADNTATPTAPAVGAFTMVYDGTNWDFLRGTAGGGAWVQGPITHDGVFAGNANPVVAGGSASAAAPADVSADGDAVRAWHLRNGAQATVITAAGALVGGDAANGLDVDVTRVTGTVTVDSELPAAVTLAENTASPTAPAVGAFGMVFDGTNWDRAPGTSAGGQFVQGNVAHDSPDTDNPLKVGGKAETTVPAAVADQDRVNAFFDEFGRLVTRQKASTATKSAVASAAVDTLLLSATDTRQNFMVTNDDANILYLSYGTVAASTTSYTVQIPPNSFYSDDQGFTGQVRGIWAADGSGSARLTEITT